MAESSLDDGRTEFLQANLVEKGETRHLDFWRVSPDGRASLIRNYPEDGFEEIPREIKQGEKWFDPWLHIRNVTEFVRHARALSEEFADAEEICFMLEWKGLEARIIASLNPDRYHGSRLSTTHVEERLVFDFFPQAEVIGDLPGVVSRLYAPIDRLFNPRSSISPESVSQQMKQFVVPGL